MPERTALSRQGRLANARGAVLLLAVYLVSLTFLLLSSISLQRTVVEVGAAQTSRNAQQALYLAEGALDEALASAKTTTLYDGIVYPTTPRTPPLLTGTATYRVFTQSAEILSPQQQRLVRRIQATGMTPSGRASTVSAYITELGPLSGTWSSGPIHVQGQMSDGLPRSTFIGNIRTNLGIGWSTKLWRGLDVVGAIQLAAPQTTGNTYNMISNAPTHSPYQWPLGSDVAGDPLYRDQCWNTCGAYLQGIPGAVPTLTGAVYDAPLKPIPAVDAPFAPQQCQGSIVDTSAAPTVAINDNSALDLNPQVGKIALCLQYVYIDGPGNIDPKLVFNAPTTVYVTSSYNGYAFSAYNTEAVNSANQLYPDGVTIIATRAANGTAGKINLRPSRFSGSVYAPESFVFIGPPVSGAQDQTFRTIVGRESQVWIPMTGRVTVDQHATDPSASSQPTVDVLSWQN